MKIIKKFEVRGSGPIQWMVVSYDSQGLQLAVEGPYPTWKACDEAHGPESPEGLPPPPEQPGAPF